MQNDNAKIPANCGNDAEFQSPSLSAGQPGTKSWVAGAVAVGAAILASACCWLPLALLGLGLSAAGLAKFVVGARWIFVAIAAAALAAGFYFSYRHKPSCAPGEACATGKPSLLRRFNRVMLWASAVLVLAFALFPYYSGPVIRIIQDRPSARSRGRTSTLQTAPCCVAPINRNPGGHQPAVQNASPGVYFYHIKNMDCKACALGLQATLSRLPHVISAKVSYRRGAASVRAQPILFNPQSVIKRMDALGYKTTLAKR